MSPRTGGSAVCGGEQRHACEAGWCVRKTGTCRGSASSARAGRPRVKGGQWCSPLAVGCRGTHTGGRTTGGGSHVACWNLTSPRPESDRKKSCVATNCSRGAIHSWRMCPHMAVQSGCMRSRLYCASWPWAWRGPISAKRNRSRSRSKNNNRQEQAREPEQEQARVQVQAQPVGTGPGPDQDQDQDQKQVQDGEGCPTSRGKGQECVGARAVRLKLVIVAARPRDQGHERGGVWQVLARRAWRATFYDLPERAHALPQPREGLAVATAVGAAGVAAKGWVRRDAALSVGCLHLLVVLVEWDQFPRRGRHKRRRVRLPLRDGLRDVALRAADAARAAPRRHPRQVAVGEGDGRARGVLDRVAGKDLRRADAPAAPWRACRAHAPRQRGACCPHLP